MFTGIIQSIGKVLENTQSCLKIEHPTAFKDVKIGSSVSVAGVCLTVTALSKKTMSFDVTAETLSVTTIGKRKKGDRMNLERALKAGDRMGGHIVQGHVEGIGEVTSDEKREMRIRLPSDLLNSVSSKGSIAIDGVSLTVSRIEGNQITIALIPFTIENTTLGSLKKGDTVNVETDIMIRSRA